MKKKILLALSIVAMLCLFVISVSAVEIDGVHYTLYEKSQAATVNKENRTAQSEIANIPSIVTHEGVEYKVNKIDNDAFSGNKTVKEIRILSEFITEIPYGMIANTYDGALEKIYIDFSNIKAVGGAGLNPSDQTNGNGPKENKFYYYDAKAFVENGTDVKITDPDFSNCTSIGSAAFQGANFEKVTIPAAVSISNQMFRMSAIKELVIEGENRETIGYYNFQACKQLEKITIKSRNLKSIANDNFATCTAVTEIYIDLSKCQEVGSCAFTFSNAYDGGQTRVQWYNLEGEKIVDLSSMKTFKDRCFSSSNLGSAKIIWPTAIEILQDQSFRKCNINQPIMINAAEGVTLKLHFWSFNENNPTILLCNEGVTETAARFSGTTAVFLAPSLKISDDKDVGFKNGSVLYCKGLAEGSKVPGGSNCTIINITDGTVSNYGACGIVANVVTADGNVTIGEVAHTLSDAIDNSLCPVGKVVVTSCAYCEYVKYTIDGEEAEKKEHSYTVSGEISYTSFIENGLKSLLCECGAVNEIKQEVSAIFICKGVSVPEFKPAKGSYSIVQGYEINSDAYKAYINSGKNLKYGIVASIAEVTGKQPLKVVDGNVCAVDENKTIVAEQYLLTADYLDVKISGLTADHNGKNLIMSLFAYDGEAIYYISKVGAESKQSDTAETIVIDIAE